MIQSVELGTYTIAIIFILKKKAKMVKYIENYALHEQIGAGVYGKVYRAINNTDKKEYAIKVISISRFRQNKKLEECTVNEINILTNIQANPHIIRYFDMLKTSNNFYFIYEHCNGGTLDTLIATEGKLSEERALIIFKQLLDAFKVLNKHSIMHRDMKPDNIFFHNGVVKLGDFGFCKNLSSADEMTKTMLGSPIYMAPEVLRGQIYSNKADIWSLGVVLYEMLFGHCPFQSNSIAKLIEVLNTKQLEFPDKISPFLQNIIARMLTKDPGQRISWMELFQIQIDQKGKIMTSEIQPKIFSLEQAKISNESVYGSSSKTISRQNQNGQGISPNGNFKKAKNQVSNTGTLTPSSSQASDSQTIEKNLLTKEHREIVEGTKLALQLVQSKIPNSMGYSFLVLTRVSKLLGEQHSKIVNPQFRAILDQQIKQIKIRLDEISSKMFTYEQKGLQDWKKYLRGKFFEEEKTIGLWYRMVFYLNDSSASEDNQTSKSMVQAIKNILY